MTSRPTMRQVAARVGVSTFTVSAVINNSSPVLPQTRTRVLEAMQALDYQPNHAARMLFHARAMSVAFVSYTSGEFADLSMGLILSGMTERLNASGYNLVIEPVSSDLEGLRSALNGGRIDGAILAAMPEQPLLNQVGSWPHPLVFFDQPQAAGDVLTVWGRYREGITLAVDHLRQRGRTRLAFVGGPPEVDMPVWHNVERYAGFLSGCQAARLPINPALIVHGDYSIEGGRQAMRLLLERRTTSPFDAVVCASDRTAVGAIIEMQSQGLAVPSDIAVTGFDDFEFAHCTVPALTTIHFPVRDLGYKAADLLLGRIEGTLASSDMRLSVETFLVVRGST